MCVCVYTNTQIMLKDAVVKVLTITKIKASQHTKERLINPSDNKQGQHSLASNDKLWGQTSLYL